ncbi:MAG TPA: hypothetical protein VFO60_06315 [Candidatus Dormibacteraeota bacterium]|nr:hypothetical protein [Candidatus Dormibacteraeota bacterium]
MDPVGLLAATVAMAVFPGGAFAVAAAAAVALGGLPGRRRAGTGGEVAGAGADAPPSLAAIAALAFAAALVPLPGSPMRSLPAAAATDNVVAVEALLCAAVVLSGGPGRRWTWTAIAAAGLAASAVLALGAVAASFAPDVVAGLTDSRGGTARLLAGGAAILVAPTLAGLGTAAARAHRLGVAGVTAALALAIGEPQSLANAAGVLSAVAALAAAAAAGLATLLPVRLRELLAAAAAALAVAVAATLL